MRYLVTWTFGPVPPEMAKIALTLMTATDNWLEGEKKAGRTIEVWSTADTAGGGALIEIESNDELYKKIMEVPYFPFMQFTVTPLTDIRVAFEEARNFLTRLAGG